MSILATPDPLAAPERVPDVLAEILREQAIEREASDPPFEATAPPLPDRWVAVNALGFARQLISSYRFSPGLAYALVAYLPETTPPAHVLFPDDVEPVR